MMNDKTFELLIFVMGAISCITYVLTLNKIVLGLFILFSVWSFVNSMTRFYKKFFLKSNNLEPIGGVKK